MSTKDIEDLANPEAGAGAGAEDTDIQGTSDTEPYVFSSPDYKCAGFRRGGRGKFVVTAVLALACTVGVLAATKPLRRTTETSNSMPSQQKGRRSNAINNLKKTDQPGSKPFCWSPDENFLSTFDSVNATHMTDGEVSMPIGDWKCLEFSPGADQAGDERSLQFNVPLPPPRWCRVPIDCTGRVKCYNAAGNQVDMGMAIHTGIVTWSTKTVSAWSSSYSSSGYIDHGVTATAVCGTKRTNGNTSPSSVDITLEMTGVDDATNSGSIAVGPSGQGYTGERAAATCTRTQMVICQETSCAACA